MQHTENRWDLMSCWAKHRFTSISISCLAKHASPGMPNGEGLASVAPQH